MFSSIFRMHFTVQGQRGIYLMSNALHIWVSPLRKVTSCNDCFDHFQSGGDPFDSGLGGWNRRQFSISGNFIFCARRSQAASDRHMQQGFGDVL
jgi:hypothetical protein